MPVRRIAHAPLRELRARTGRTASLAVLWGTEVAYIDRWHGSLQGQHVVDGGIGLGTRMPVHCSAAGKALLARLPAAEQQALITELRLTRRTPKTITAKTALRAELERIVAQGGVAIEDEELSACRRAIAIAVMDPEGRPVAAVELAAPAQAYTGNALPAELRQKVIATAQRIASALQRRSWCRRHTTDAGDLEIRGGHLGGIRAARRGISPPGTASNAGGAS
ncbi:MAG: IclR family transcriptional regulator C-terminal domain-containing protein, partial [Solirubrobacteraceae bacterium]